VIAVFVGCYIAGLYYPCSLPAFTAYRARQQVGHFMRTAGVDQKALNLSPDCKGWVRTKRKLSPSATTAGAASAYTFATESFGNPVPRAVKISCASTDVEQDANAAVRNAIAR
jgi:hypothetical protein